MSPRKTNAPRLTIAAAVAILLAAAILILPVAGRGQDAALVTPSAAYPVSGLPARDVMPLGASPGSDPTEVWGIGYGFAPKPDGTGTVQAHALMHQVGDGGWQTVSFAESETGDPIDRNFTPLLRVGPGPGRVTPKGGVVVAATRDGKGMLLGRAPGAPLRPLPAPVQGDTAAGAELRDDETLVGHGRVTLAAVDASGGLGLFVAPLAAEREAEGAVLFFDGATWHREKIDLPAAVPPATADFTVAAIAASDVDHAWLLGSDGRTGLQLYERDLSGPDPEWKQVSLSSSPVFATTTARALVSPAESLTVGGDGLWLDGAYESAGAERTFTLYYDLAEGKVTRSWCNTGACSDQLEFELSAAPAPDATSSDIGDASALLGYRSFAWAGDGPGTRVVTNPRAGADGDGSDPSTYALFDGQRFSRVRAYGPREAATTRAMAAFTDARTGWLTQDSTRLIRVSPAPPGPRLQAYPLPVRAPLLAVAPEPGRSPADPSASALAVGYNGQVLRYAPGTGWLPEPLPSGSGRATPRLTAVAWPESRRAHAVGADGAMWIWRAEAQQWERDEGAPVDADGELFTGVAFQPGSADRGYAITQSGRIYRYDKSWTPESVPRLSRETLNELFGIAFSGSQALVAAGTRLLVNDGGGWRADEEVAALLKQTNNARIFAVAGLPDGGAIAAGDGVVLKRDRAGAPWRLGENALSGGAVRAVSAVRDGDVVRAVAVLAEPASEDIPDADLPGQPPLIQPVRLPVRFGSVVRETASGWSDEERAGYPIRSFTDCPLVPDPALGLALDERGQGWIVGGDTGQRSDFRCATADVDLATPAAPTQTAVAWRYGDNPAAPTQIERSDGTMTAGPARLLIGGHAACAAACAELASLGISPDRNLAGAVELAATLRSAANGPRAWIYTGGRVAGDVGAAHGGEQARYAQLMTAAASRVPVYVTPSQTDAGIDAAGFNAQFAGLPAPQGHGAAPANVSTAGVPGGEPVAGARTHYAFDTTGPEGALRVVVIDNAKGSIGGRDQDASQYPAESQVSWLESTLDDARGRRVPAIVVGSRPLTEVGEEKGNARATDGDTVARILLDHGASAYFFDSPELNVSTRIPKGSATTIPSFGSGSLGYEGIPPSGGQDVTDNGLLLVEADLAARDASTNRVPVRAAVQPVIEDLAIDARDGTQVRRSTPALFTGLGRRPRGGGRILPGSVEDPYVSLPNPDCRAGCGVNVAATARFTSSNPEVGDFVRVDPAQAANNPRAVFLGSDSKPVADSASGLFCAFNPGTTDISITTGGLTYATKVTVLAGSPRQPCGTRATTPLPEPVGAASPTPAAPPAAAPVAEATPGAGAPPPAPPVQAPVAAQPVPTPVAVTPGPVPVIPPLPVLPPVPPSASSPLVVAPPPPVGGVGRPSPPGGATVRVYEEKREQEEAFEQSSASVRYEAGARHGVPNPALTLGLLIVAAGAGSTLARRRRDPRGPRFAQVGSGTRR
ncbi:MAG: hypothetical protein JHC95_11675 [Solirubrobacteraceae bacterium]|nr:hypothetical protein [Solirubrobacteraceae bacterium]